MLANLQNHTVTASRPTPSKGASGGEKDAYTSVYLAMPCRVIDATPTWQVLYAQRKISLTHQVFTSYGPAVRTGDRLLWGTRTLMVVGVIDLGGAGQVARLDCQELL